MYKEHKRGAKMTGTINDYKNIIESLVSIFTIENGEVKMFLLRKQAEPYKGYWILPSDIITVRETLEDNVNKLIYDKLGIKNLYIEQCHVFSNPNRDNDERIVGCSFIGLIDNISVQLHKKDGFIAEWFPINSIPKLGYDHGIIAEESVKYLRKRIVNSNLLKILLPSDFTLPELQKVYEQILNKPLDRRNFRKKFVNLGLIEDTNQKTDNHNGRPAKLYRFKDNLREINLY